MIFDQLLPFNLFFVKCTMDPAVAYFKCINYSMLQRGVYSLHLCKPVSWSHKALPKSCSISWRHATSTRITQHLLQADRTSVRYKRIVFPDMLWCLRHMSEWISHYTNGNATYWADPLPYIYSTLVENSTTNEGSPEVSASWESLWEVVNLICFKK